MSAGVAPAGAIELQPGGASFYQGLATLRYRQDPRFAAFCRKVGLPVLGEVSARKST